MKQGTRVWIKCESSGRPADTLILNSTTREAILAIGKWMLETYMGNHITIRVARTEVDLTRNLREVRDADMMGELESLLGGTPEPSDQNDNDTEFDQSPQCPHGNRLNERCQDCVREHQIATM